MYEKGSGVQGFQQFGVNAVKTAVAHYQNNVSRLGFLADGGDDFLRCPPIRASLPSAERSLESLVRSRRSSRATLSGWSTAATTGKSAVARDRASSFWKMFLRVVLERGSKMAQMRDPG